MRNNYKIYLFIFLNFHIFSQNENLEIVHASVTGYVTSENKVKFNIQSKFDIYGIQFIINYNRRDIIINNENIKSLHYKNKIYSQNINDSTINVIILGEKGKILHDANKNIESEILVISPIINNNFSGQTIFYLSNMKLAGHGGKEIVVKEEENLYKLNYNQNFINTLYQNDPDPFLNKTLIKYILSDEGFVSLLIYDLNGVIVNKLIDEYHEPGIYSINWHGEDNSDNLLPNGKYILKLLSVSYSETITLTILR